MAGSFTNYFENQVIDHMLRNQSYTPPSTVYVGLFTSAPVTRGVIETNRQAVYLPDADVVWNGHSHHGWVVPISRERLSNKGTVYQDLAWFVRTPGYKAEYLNDDIGYAAQKAAGPTPIGCIRLTLEYNDLPMVKAELVV